LDPNVGVVFENIRKVKDHRAGPAFASSTFDNRKNCLFRLTDPSARLVWIHVLDASQVSGGK
jgi:hypothetical protein